jgi:transcriptional regulator with XRE-family HTH domain
MLEKKKDRTARAALIARRVADMDEAYRVACKTIREDNGKTQQAIADFLGWSLEQYANFEKGRKHISPGYIAVLAAAMDEDVFVLHQVASDWEARHRKVQRGRDKPRR